MIGQRHKVAIIGTGNIIMSHVKAFRGLRRFEIAGIFGRDMEHTRKVAERVKLKAFASFDEILADESIDVVDIASSSDLHASYGLRAAKSRKNLIIEKPIDASVEKAEELIRQCQKGGLLLGVIYQKRFDEITLLLKSLIAKGLFGRLLSGRVICRPRRDADFYKSSRGKSKGILMNNGIHFIDQIISILGSGPVAVKGILKETRPMLGMEDYALVSMEFKDSFMFTVDIASNVKKTLPAIFELNGEKGSIILWDDKVRFISIKAPFSFSMDYLKLFGGRYCLPIKLKSGTHEDVFRNFLAALDGKERLSVDGPNALVSLKIVDGIYREATGEIASS